MVQMSKKDVPLPQRPEPPSVEQIVEDVESAGQDDVIFVASGKPESDGDSITTYDSFSCEDSSPRADSKDDARMPDSAQNLHDTSGSVGSTDIETVYRQAVQFIEVTERLKDGPEQLRTLCERLQKVGKEMTDSIEELKRQSSVVLKEKPKEASAGKSHSKSKSKRKS